MTRSEKFEDLLTTIITLLVLKGICTQEEFSEVLEEVEALRKEKQNEAR